jgi:predicted RND superfamily exporter protein
LSAEKRDDSYDQDPDSEPDDDPEQDPDYDEDDLNDWGDEPSRWESKKRSEAYDVKPLEETAPNIAQLSKKMNTAKRGADAYLDTLLSRATGTAERSREKLDEYKPKIKSGAKRAAKRTKRTILAVDSLGDKYSRKVLTTNIFDKITDFIIKKPILILTIVGLITGVSVLWGIIGLPIQTNSDGELQTKIQENIRGDFEVYLPQGHETKTTLDEIQEDWSTDIIIAFVEVPNSLPTGDPEWSSDTNITDIEVLKEMDSFESHFNEFREGEQKNEDGIVFLLSFSSLVKEINSTPPRFKNALEEESELAKYLPELGYLEGDYTIPDNPDIIRALFEQIPPESRDKVILDSNDDTIYDTGIILIGITQDIDQEKLVKDMREYVKDFKHCKITLTGPIPMTQAITARTYSEFIKTLPAAIVLVAGILILFHRNWRIVLITGIPVLCSLAITFGILGGTNMTLTPQVVLIAPILIALGVAYGLYIANRYSDEKQIKDREERIKVAVRTTGKAVFLSALTTAIGFGSLLTVQMIPLQVLGFGLSMGIMICYAITMLTVPSLVMALNYRKKGEIKVKEKIGNFPIVHRKKIVGAAVILVIISVILIPSVQANMNFIKMAPQDEPVILKMREYSDKFGGGQQGMIMVTGKASDGNDVDNSMREFDTLDKVNDLADELRTVENTNVISIIDFMKMIKPSDPDNDELNDLIDLIEENTRLSYNTSFWKLIEKAPDTAIITEKSMQLILIDVFYNTLSSEMRGMLLNSDYSKTLLYIDMPSMDVVNTKKAVLKVDEITDDLSEGRTFDVSHLTGFGAILVAVNDMLIFNSIQSTIIALVVVLIVLALIFKSIKFSAITLIPVCFVVILQPLTLISIGGLGGILNPADPVFTGELNLFSAVIGSIIVGIGIDFGIHMTERIREHGFNLDGIRNGVATSGMAFVEATVTMIGGLSAVFLIEIPAIQEFILLVMILLTYSVLGALFVLTAIYTIIVRRQEERKQRVSKFEEYITGKGPIPVKGGTEDKLPIGTTTSLEAAER